MEQQEEKIEFFKDGWNSLYRLVGGIFSALLPSVFIPLCIGYQAFGPSDTVNMVVWLREFLVGYLVGTILISMFKIVRFIGLM